MSDVDGSSPPHPDEQTTKSCASVLPATESDHDFTRENPTIAIVQDSSEYLDAINGRKDANARWVRGLSYEDEVNELYTEYVRTQMRNGEGAATATFTYPQGNAPRWLRYPLYCFIIYVVLEVQSYQDSFHAQYRREFPINDLQLARSGRQRGENFFAFVTRVLMPLFMPSLFTSAGAFMMACTIGTATHHFVALCGIGLAALSWLAVLAQALTLWAACDVSDHNDNWECEIPFNFYWVCSVIRVGGPLLSLWAVTPMLDLARHAGYRWRVLMAMPVLAFVVAVVVKVTASQGSTFHTPLDVCYFASMTALAALTFVCWKQEPFEVVIRPVKLHVE